MQRSLLPLSWPLWRFALRTLWFKNSNVPKTSSRFGGPKLDQLAAPLRIQPGTWHHHSSCIQQPFSALNEVIEMNQTPRLGVHPSTIKRDRARARFSAGYKLLRRVMIFHNHKSIAGIALGLPSGVAACYAGGNRRFVRKSPRGCRLEGT
jgi:hypothetical protein